MTTRMHRIRSAVIAGLAVVTFPLTIAAGCENEGGDDDPGVEQNDDQEQDDQEDDDG